MSLSKLRMAIRPCLTVQRSALIPKRVSSSEVKAHEEMRAFWEKNHRLGRPLTHFTTYRMHQPMLMSLGHRISGIAMGVAFYGLVIGLYVMPGDFTHYIDLLKSFDLPKWFLFPAKMVVAFPLMYHYMNGMRHLSWDAGKGVRLATMYKTGWSILAAAIVASACVASLSYW
ncbi:Succinate dehydrogenase cytochrome b560 subunit, mitochondrial [Lamellibrachia satsuma]|nr:Succinate dehydrogenase cytochrome b560 subunit, mitochondrial [Lamellibrachia satsuma]